MDPMTAASPDRESTVPARPGSLVDETGVGAVGAGI
jgi:hypothetical protein